MLLQFQLSIFMLKWNCSVWR